MKKKLSEQALFLNLHKTILIYREKCNFLLYVHTTYTNYTLVKLLKKTIGILWIHNYLKGNLQKI